jgi:hypothetical protein
MIRKVLVGLLVALYLFAGNSAPINDNGEYFLYRAVEQVKPGHFPLNQGAYGSCVAFGHAAGCDTLLAIDCVTGKAAKFMSSSPDAIYGGSRNEAYGTIYNRGGQGSTGVGATRWLSKFGVLYQQAYQVEGRGIVDLTNYDIPRTDDWGKRGSGGSPDGYNGPLDKEAARHPIKGIAKVTTLEDLDAALKNGYPVTICSSQGFSRTRDKDGFCKAQGSWNHCMCVLGKRGGGRKGYLILNSWGDYVSGPKYKDQPDGSFYCEPETMARILRYGDSWAMSKQSGFPRGFLPEWLTSPDLKAPPLAEVKPATKAVAKATAAQLYQTICANGRCYRRLLP